MGRDSHTFLLPGEYRCTCGLVLDTVTMFPDANIEDRQPENIYPDPRVVAFQITATDCFTRYRNKPSPASKPEVADLRYCPQCHRQFPDLEEADEPGF